MPRWPGRRARRARAIRRLRRGTRSAVGGRAGESSKPHSAARASRRSSSCSSCVLSCSSCGATPARRLNVLLVLSPRRGSNTFRRRVEGFVLLVLLVLLSGSSTTLELAEHRDGAPRFRVDVAADTAPSTCANRSGDSVRAAVTSSRFAPIPFVLLASSVTVRHAPSARSASSSAGRSRSGRRGVELHARGVEVGEAAVLAAAGAEDDDAERVGAGEVAGLEARRATVSRRSPTS